MELWSDIYWICTKILFYCFSCFYYSFFSYFFFSSFDSRTMLRMSSQFMQKMFFSVYLLIGRDIIQKFCEKKFIPFIDIHSYLSALYDSLNWSEWMYEFFSNTQLILIEFQWKCCLPINRWHFIESAITTKNDNQHEIMIMDRESWALFLYKF